MPEYSMAILGMQQGIEVMALKESRIAIIGGEPFEPRRMNWNFISTSKERIDQARADWKAHRFPLIPGDDKEFIPLPE
nr:pirin-like C-terminal cupin domain-containing protein [Marinobacter nauticus]